MLDDIKTEHNSVQANIARGLQELAKERKDVQQQKDVLMHAGTDSPCASAVPFDFGQFLDRFYLSRVGVRVLIGQETPISCEPVMARKNSMRAVTERFRDTPDKVRKIHQGNQA
eukprot:766636-Hanusia_phi.AAC.5